MLSHHNVLSNIEAIDQIFRVGAHDCIAGVLPFFHSFGYTITIWFPLVTGCGVVYHPNPTDAKAIGDLVAKYRATLLLSTPTFCSTYTRKCSAEDFASLRFALVGAEKLREPVAAAFSEKFGVELLEGYGTHGDGPGGGRERPRLSRGSRYASGQQTRHSRTSASRCRRQDRGSAELPPLPPHEEGLLLVKGPNCMIGYLGEPERTAAVFHDGWYITGDIARIDDEGFIQITDRLSRFSKIAGEMVPHLRIEEAVGGILGDVPCAVTAIADDQRGERLVALYIHSMNGSDLWQRLSETDLPRLWIPKRENLYQVQSLPLLGTGKLDLRALKSLAQELAAVTA